MTDVVPEMRVDVRERLLDTVLGALCESAPEDVDPRRIAAAAGIGAAEFEAEFGDEEGCLLAASERLGAMLVGEAARACGEEGDWPRRVGAGLRRLLNWLAERPDLAGLALRSLPGRNRAAHERYESMLDGFAALLGGGRAYSPAGTELPSEIEMLAVGAAEAIIFDEVAAGRASRLPALTPNILFSVLVPFLGPEEASAESQRAA